MVSSQSAESHLDNGDFGDFSQESGPSAKPRLFIREMVMKNFKSYAGEQRVGPFHKVSLLPPILSYGS